MKITANNNGTFTAEMSAVEVGMIVGFISKYMPLKQQFGACDCPVCKNMFHIYQSFTDAGTYAQSVFKDQLEKYDNEIKEYEANKKANG